MGLTGLKQRDGVTIIFIRQDIKHNEILFPHLHHMEATVIQSNINKESIILIWIHNHPGKIIKRYLDHLLGTRHKIILVDDFNAKHGTWRARQNNAVGHSLLKHYYKNNYVISAPSQPMHFPDRTP
jgi:hypothetical protein